MVGFVEFGLRFGDCDIFFWSLVLRVFEKEYDRFLRERGGINDVLELFLLNWEIIVIDVYYRWVFKIMFVLYRGSRLLRVK